MTKEEMIEHIEEHFDEMDAVVCLGKSKGKFFRFVGKELSFGSAIGLLTLAIWDVYNTMNEGETCN